MGIFFFDKWLKEFHLLQTRGTGGDLFMICKDCLKAGKKDALVCHMPQVDLKSTAKVLQQRQCYKAASDNASGLDEESLTKQMQTTYWLSKEEMPSVKLLRPTKNARDTYLARYAGPRTQTKNS